MAIKVCPVVIRIQNDRRFILAFHHPTAGTQIVKGTPEPHEPMAVTALRELWEESGIIAIDARAIGTASPDGTDAVWHFFLCSAPDMPDTWSHQTADDHGHVFRFFWHPLDETADKAWHPMFRAAVRQIACFLDTGAQFRD